MPHGKACSEKMWACFYLPQGTATLNYAILISESAKGEYTVRDNNTQGKTEFITEHIFWLALAWIWYRSLLFRCVPQHTLTESKLILLGFVLVFSAVGILFQMHLRPPLSRLRPSPRRRFLPAGHAGCARPVQRRCYGWPDNLSQQDKAPI